MEIENLFKALAHKNRLRILNLLYEQELCVCELKNIMSTTQSNVSRHLGKLKNSDIISSRRDAQWIYYEIDSDFLAEHEFLQIILEEELQEDIFEQDIKRMKAYMDSDLDCGDLREGKSIISE